MSEVRDGAQEPAAAAEAPAEAPVEATATVEPVETETKKPKSMGRPVGAKDSKPRQRKRVEVRVEPIETPKPEPQSEPPVKIEEHVSSPPPSPRTLLRETSRHLMTLRGMVHDARRSDLGTKYAQKLSSWRPVPHFV